MTVSVMVLILAAVLVFAVGYAVGRRVGRLQGFTEGLYFAPLNRRAQLMIRPVDDSDELPMSPGPADRWDAGGGRIPANHVE